MSIGFQAWKMAGAEWWLTRAAIGTAWVVLKADSRMQKAQAGAAGNRGDIILSIMV
jgi:hypothetical protein